MSPLALVCSLWLCWLASFSKASQFSRVSFLEAAPGSYLRGTSSDGSQEGKFSYADVSAATSVLLGSAPSSPVDNESASKLNELLMPDPFHRPRAVLLLTLEQVKPVSFKSNALEQGGNFGSFVVHDREIQQETMKSELLLPEDLSVLPLNMTSKGLSESSSLEIELEDMASFLGASYEMSKGSKGAFDLQLIDGDMITLDLEKEEHWTLIDKVSSMIKNIKASVFDIDMMQGGLIFGSLTVSKDLYEAPDSGITSKEASELLHLIAVKMFTYLNNLLNGGLVGVIVDAPEPVLDMKFTSRPSHIRMLQVSADSITATVAEVLTETIIAYITGIILIIALIIATCCLFKMPLTRDTLLYSGAKLD
ncbi:hypothetical protein KP509_11G084000 [Ceratopteris richardii]|uniref:DUF7794 domain-containing protein n=1 Tax=Ceratopteris richardii TaxID=49495 RepID=A0A8T2TXL1_CERRI|nr:hypothetical protein KP509_11G084000 [Ceratopteris richardii]